MAMTWFIWMIIFIALIFDFLNGVNDAANSVATVVSTRVLRPWQAVLWAAFFNFVAAFGFGTAVALTIGKGIVDPGAVEPMMVLGALLGAICWTYTAAHFGIPISVSHALIGGLIGATIIFAGMGAIIIGPKLFMTIAFIAISPLVGMGMSYVMMLLVLRASSKMRPAKVDKQFRKMQIISAAVFSYGHGANDAQKTMGIILVLLISAGYFGDQSVKDIGVPIWVILICHAAIAAGTIAGGYKTIKTMGMRLTKLEPIHGFSAETSGAMTVLGCSLVGIPISTTHTITGCILGAGATKGAKSVRWGVARNIVWAWILTIPISALIGAFAMWSILMVA